MLKSPVHSELMIILCKNVEKPALPGGRYWDRTSGFHRVKVALYR